MLSSSLPSFKFSYKQVRIPDLREYAVVGDPRRECGRVATPSRAAAAELSAPAGAGPRDGGERGRGVDGLGDGSAGDRGRGAGARGRRRVWSPGWGTAQGRGTGLGDGAAS